jgi:hypothetical protein
MKILDLRPPIEQKFMVREYPAFFRALELASPSSFCSDNRYRIASSFPCLFVFLLSVWQEEALYYFTCRGERGGGGDSSNDSKKRGLLKSILPWIFEIVSHWSSVSIIVLYYFMRRFSVGMPNLVVWHTLCNFTNLVLSYVMRNSQYVCEISYVCHTLYNVLLICL